jgi:two-component system nitrate/nitrite response regulator NarL
MKSSARSIALREGAVFRTAARTYRGPASAVGDALPGRAKIALIDDDWAVLSRLRAIIEQNSDLEVVAARRCAEGAMLAVRHHRPAVMILDVRLPDQDGFELIRDITAISQAKVIVFTAPLQKSETLTALRSGAKAIVFKDQPISTLISCVRDALAGEECMASVAAIPQPPAVSASLSVNGLSPREREVAQWAVAGARNKEIAWQLGISEGAVKLHLFHVYQKLRVSNRVGLVLALPKTAIEIFAGITFVSLTLV